MILALRLDYVNGKRKKSIGLNILQRFESVSSRDFFGKDLINGVLKWHRFTP
jgi:hypothetical protein